METSSTFRWIFILFVTNRCYCLLEDLSSEGLPVKFFNTTYSSSLTSSNPTFIRFNSTDSPYYYELIQIIVMTDGFYTLTSSGDLDSHLFLYEYEFDDLLPSSYLIAIGTKQEPFDVYLHLNFKYYLVVTTDASNQLGTFDLVITGENYLNLIGNQVGSPVTSTYDTLVSDTFRLYARPDRLYEIYYYDLLAVNFSASGSYVFRSNSTNDNYGYLYRTQFDQSAPTQNLLISNDDYGVDKNFRITANLTVGETYYLVFTWWSPSTFDSVYSLMVSGPAPVILSSRAGEQSLLVIESNYLVSLTADEPVFKRYLGSGLNYHYQLLLIDFNTSGIYTFKTNTSAGLFLYLYSDSFNPSTPDANLLNYAGTNLLTGFLQFSTLIYSSIKYYLVITTGLPSTLMSATLNATGPSQVTFENITFYSRQYETSYRFSWASNHSTFVFPNENSFTNYSYELIQVTVLTDGPYTFKRAINITTIALLYSDSFNASSPLENLIINDDGSSSESPFEFTITLYSYYRYYLVIATLANQNAQGTFELFVTGNQYVNLVGNQIVGWPLSTMQYFPVDVGLKQYFRPGGQPAIYYYRLTEVKVPVNGLYTFRAQGYIDNYGYLYIDQFYESEPERNLIVSNDDYGTDPNFGFTKNLSTNHTYYLVFTWANPDIFDRWDGVVVSGPAQIILNIIDALNPIYSNYSISLTNESPSFTRYLSVSSGFRYELILLDIVASGIYTFDCISTVQIYAYLYYSSFDPQNSWIFLYQFDGGILSGSGSKITTHLSAFHAYYLLITTYLPGVTGDITLTVTGPATTDFTLMINFPSTVDTIYSSSLNPLSPIFARPGETDSSYYYALIELNTLTNGGYTFLITNTVGPFVFLYAHQFDPLASSTNLVIQSGTTESVSQITFQSYLDTYTKYYLVVTTALSNQIGTFQLKITGENYVNLTGDQISNPRWKAYYSPPTTDFRTFSRPFAVAGNYYYQLIKLEVTEAGSYTFRALGAVDNCAYLYVNEFNESLPTQNLVSYNDDYGTDPNFRLSVDLTDSENYYLVYSWWAERALDFSVGMVVSGPSEMSLITLDVVPSITSNYPSSLKITSPTFVRPYGAGTQFYYQLFRVSVPYSSMYAFQASSALDTFCYLYWDTFDSSSPDLNLLIADDDSSSNNQCLLQGYLWFQLKYYVLITTYQPNVLGNITMFASGPFNVDVLPITSSSDVDTLYSSQLTRRKFRFRRHLATKSLYYYDLIQVTANVTGRYTFRSTSNQIDLFGCLYEDHFIATSPSKYLIICNDALENNNRFLFLADLVTDRKYFLVITTSLPNRTGQIAAVITGAITVNLFPIKNSLVSKSTYLSRLTTGSLNYRRHFRTDTPYYYDLIRITTSITTTYDFRSSSATNLIGFLYIDTFIASVPSINLLTYDDQSAGADQFRFTTILIADQVYYLVVTTSLRNRTSKFNVTITGAKAPTILQMSASASIRVKITSVLTSSSPLFSRWNASIMGDYYYDLVRIYVNKIGLYTFRTNSSVTINPFCYIYKTLFDDSSPETNLLTFKSQSRLGINSENQFVLTLETTETYYLLITTSVPSILGNIVTTISGPGRVMANRIGQKSSKIYAPSVQERSMSPNQISNYFSYMYSPTDQSLSLHSILFNRDDFISINGYLHTITIHYAQGHVPSVKTRLWIYTFIPTFNTYVISQRFQIPSSQISTTSINQTYIIFDHHISASVGSYVGVSSDDEKVHIITTNHGNLVFIDYDYERNQIKRITCGAPQKGVDLQYTINT